MIRNAGADAELAIGPPRVSVIIPHLNTPDVLDRCLTSVAAQRLDRGYAEIIVVDNGSTVSLAEVEAAWPAVRFLREPTPGPGPARNAGVLASRAPVVAFIDADCRAGEGWLQSAVDAVEVDPEHAVIGGEVLIDFVDPEALTAAEAYEAVFAYRQETYIRTRRFSGTGNLAMHRAIHQKVGPFGGIEIAEDIDWGERACALGYPARFNRAMRIYHPARPGFDSLAEKWRRHVAHAYVAHRNNGNGLLHWYAHAAAVVASIPVSGVQLMTSPKLKGLANRWQGFTMLARLRLFRAAEMLRATSGVSQARSWNRGA